MCGIAGAIGAVDARIEAAVRAMMNAQAHRGPDDSGLFRSEGEQGVVLGFQRLSILDLTPEGHQPMIDAESGNVVVFNGEVYNYAELRRELEGQRTNFRSTGDTEVLLRGYGRWGASVVQRLRGMYDFAIFDPRRREVLLARDRLGIKPLYYAEVSTPGGKVLLFASELRALLASGLLERRLDPRGLATYLWNGFVVGPSTMIRGIKLLGPGELMRVSIDDARPRSERYWSLGKGPQLDADEAVDALERELRDATRQHLASDVPLGVFLSGGVDSSAVAALAVRAGSQRVKTFHIGFEEPKFDESAYARRVASSLGTEHAELTLTQARSSASSVPRWAASISRPSTR
jgi:asparagine synthase (glutamine-hydrolysing)